MKYFVLDIYGEPLPAPDPLIWALQLASGLFTVAKTIPNSDPTLIISTTFLGVGESVATPMFETLVSKDGLEIHKVMAASVHEALANHTEAVIAHCSAPGFEQVVSQLLTAIKDRP